MMNCRFERFYSSICDESYGAIYGQANPFKNNIFLGLKTTNSTVHYNAVLF